jgi:hypothetical protein
MAAVSGGPALPGTMPATYSHDAANERVQWMPPERLSAVRARHGAEPCCMTCGVRRLCEMSSRVVVALVV